MITAGIDMGSRSIKVILLEELKVDGAPQLKYGVKKAHIMMPGDLDQDVAADKAYNDPLEPAGLKQNAMPVGAARTLRAVLHINRGFRVRVTSMKFCRKLDRWPEAHLKSRPVWSLERTSITGSNPC